MRKPVFFCICQNKGADQLRSKRKCAVNSQLMSAFVFATKIVQFLLLLKFQASSHVHGYTDRFSHDAAQWIVSYDVAHELCYEKICCNSIIKHTTEVQISLGICTI